MTKDVAASPITQHKLQDFEWIVAIAERVLGGKVMPFFPGSFRSGLQAISVLVGTKPLVDNYLVSELEQDEGVKYGVAEFIAEGDPGIPFIRLRAPYETTHQPDYNPVWFTLKSNYEPLRERLLAVSSKEAAMPFLAGSSQETFRRNTLEFLHRSEDDYALYDIPFRRGVILTGPPGNGKTMACRWLVQQCKKFGYNCRVVLPQDYLHAQGQPHGISKLFQFDVDRDVKPQVHLLVPPKRGMKAVTSDLNKGVVIFDDIDQALHRRDGSGAGWDQAHFLSHLEGVERPEGVVYVFTTNSPVDQIDPAIIRPGRIDVVLPFNEPDEPLVRQFVWEAWPESVTQHLAPDAHVDLYGMSYAVIDEIKRLFVLGFLDRGEWDWAGALESYAVGRENVEKMKVAGLASVSG